MSIKVPPFAGLFQWVRHGTLPKGICCARREALSSLGRARERKCSLAGGKGARFASLRMAYPRWHDLNSGVFFRATNSGRPARNSHDREWRFSELPARSAYRSKLSICHAGLRRMTRGASAGWPGAECSAQLFTERRKIRYWRHGRGDIYPPAHRDEKRSWIAVATTATANVEVRENPSRKASCPLHGSKYFRQRRVPEISDHGRHSRGVRFRTHRRARQNMQDHLA